MYDFFKYWYEYKWKKDSVKESNWCKKGRFELKFAGFRMEFKVIQVALYFKCDSAIGEKSGESFSFEI